MSCGQYAAMLGFYAPYVYICKRAELNGASSDDAAMLLSLIGARACVRAHTCAGITNTAGRVVYGWLADRQWVSSQTLVNMSMLMVAVANCALAATAAYVCAVVYALVFGFIVGRVSMKCCMLTLPHSIVPVTHISRARRAGGRRAIDECLWSVVRVSRRGTDIRLADGR